MSDPPGRDDAPADPMAFADAEARDLTEERAIGRQSKKRTAPPWDSGEGEPDPPKAGVHQPRPLPPNCPVVPLGMSGSARWYLDAKGQLIELPVSRHVKAEIQGLFCDQAGLVLEYWTRINDKTGRADGWHPERAMLDLLTASGARTWSPVGRVRGRGCWMDNDAGLVVHAGDAVWHDGNWKPPGVISGKVYPAGEPVMRPAASDAPGQLGGPGQVLLDLFSRWNFARELDARLCVGQFAANFAGGALRWRPAMWIYGEPETGKSTLVGTFEALTGGFLLTSEDTTAAGVWQLLEYDSLPLALDEAGDDIDPKRAIALLRLIRVLTGGGKITRGGAAHRGRQFAVSASIMCSSVARPPMLPQDVSRIVPIHVLKPKEPPPQPEPRTLSVLGAQIFQRVVDGWPRYATACEAYLAAFAAAELADRATRNYATLLALAHIVVSDLAVDADIARRHVGKLAEDLKEAKAEASSSHEAWLRHLRSRMLPFEGATERLTVYELIRDAALSARNDLCLTEGTGSNAANILKQVGIVIRRPKNGGRVAALAIANEHAGLTRLHQDTPWAGGHGRRGGWVDAARGLTSAERCTARFLGPPERGTSIPLDVALGSGWETGATRWVDDEVPASALAEIIESGAARDDER